MSFVQSPLDYLWEPLERTLVHTVEEEGCHGAVFSELVQHLCCVDVRPIVEGEGYCAWHCAVSEDCSDWDVGGDGIVWSGEGGSVCREGGVG